VLISTEPENQQSNHPLKNNGLVVAPFLTLKKTGKKAVAGHFCVHPGAKHNQGRQRAEQSQVYHHSSNSHCPATGRLLCYQEHVIHPPPDIIDMLLAQDGEIEQQINQHNQQ